MIRLRTVTLGFVWLLAALARPGHAAVRVTVLGDVEHPGARMLADDARLADALLAAGVRPDAYTAGAAWLRPALEPAQRRLKAGLAYELALFTARARLRGDAAGQALGERMLAQLRRAPVTGRQPASLLDPRPLELSDRNRHPGQGDRVLFPPRPATVSVTGAVRADCTLPHVPLQDARRYLDACPVDSAADSDWLYVIQPDGMVSRRGIAAWNRATPQALAPGAILYVPLRLRTGDDPQLNDDMAAWLATRVLPGAMP